MLDELDPFRDGRAAERMGTYLQWLIEGFRDGRDREAIMADAAERYCTTWGSDKVTQVEAGVTARGAGQRRRASTMPYCECVMRSDILSSPRYSAVFHFLGRYKRLFISILLLTLISSVVESASVVAFFPIFSSLLNSSQEDAGGILGFMTSMADLLPFGSPIVGAAVLLIVIFLLKTLFTLLREFLTAYVASKIHYDIKKQMMERYAGAHYQYILDTPQGTLLFQLLEASGAVPGVLQNGASMATALLKVLTITIVLITILPYGALGLASVAVVYYATMHYLSNKVSYHLGRRGVEASAGQSIVANEFLSGFRQIITFNAGKWWTSKFERESFKTPRC